MATENLGRVLMDFTGDYDASKSYTYLDEVTYNGSSYVCIVDAQNIMPTDTSHWKLLAKAGKDGQNGTVDSTTIANLKAQLEQYVDNKVQSAAPSSDSNATLLAQAAQSAASEAQSGVKSNSNAITTLSERVSQANSAASAAMKKATDALSAASAASGSSGNSSGIAINESNSYTNFDQVKFTYGVHEDVVIMLSSLKDTTGIPSLTGKWMSLTGGETLPELMMAFVTTYCNSAACFQISKCVTYNKKPHIFYRYGFRSDGSQTTGPNDAHPISWEDWILLKNDDGGIISGGTAIGG